MAPFKHSAQHCLFCSRQWNKLIGSSVLFEGEWVGPRGGKEIEKKKKRYLSTESPSLTLIPLAKSRLRNVFLPFLGNIEILSFCRLLLQLLPFIHHVFPLIRRLQGHWRYSFCFHGISSSVRPKKKSHLLSHAFHDLSNVSRLFRPHQPYALSCFCPGGNGQLPSHALVR